MNFVKTAGLLVHASQPVVWVRTHEETEARKELLSELKVKADVFRWNVLSGFISPNSVEVKLKSSDGLGDTSMAGGAAGLIGSIGMFREMVNDPKTKMKHFVLLVDNFHQFLHDPSALYPIMQALQDFSASDRKKPCSIMLIAHYNQRMPDDLKSYCSIVDHDLPTAEELRAVTEDVLATVEGPMVPILDKVTTSHIVKLTQAGLGLSRLQYESELSFSLAAVSVEMSELPDLDEDTITEMVVQGVQDRKAALFNAEGLVRLHRSTDRVSDIGGMQGLKNLIKRRFDRQNTRFRTDRYPRGLILLGPPGTAKSTFARAIGNFLGVLTATIDIGSIKEGIVGASEGRIRRVFQILKAMGRIIAFVDEIEKAFPTGNELDSGVSADILSVWLTNLSDPDRQYYVIASANNCHKLPAPLLRSGRFDNIVMVDLPKSDQQKLIWDICMKRYGIENQTIPDHQQWSGAEIDACCEAADGMGMSLAEAASMIVPTAVLTPDAVTAVRDYAHNRAIDAETGVIYRKPGSEPQIAITNPPAKRGRTIVAPSNPANN